jgi:hypothetical protein
MASWIVPTSHDAPAVDAAAPNATGVVLELGVPVVAVPPPDVPSTHISIAVAPRTAEN